MSTAPRNIPRRVAAICAVAVAAAAFAPLAAAQVRASAHYTIVAETLDAGGGAGTSAHCVATTSTGPAATLATSAATTAKGGFPGQLYDPLALQVTAAPASVDENGARPLAPALVLDDATTLAVAPDAPAWSVLAGPLTVSPAGVASGRTVFADTPATVRAVHRGFIADLALTVRNVHTDDFGTYAGDGLADDWQVQFFGEDHPWAGPALDPDGDGQDNRFEFVAGLDPLDAESRLRVRIESVPAQPAWKSIVFSPRRADRVYHVERTSRLGPAADWQPLAGAPVSDAGTERTVTDPAATGPAQFYRVAVTRP